MIPRAYYLEIKIFYVSIVLIFRYFYKRLTDNDFIGLNNKRYECAEAMKMTKASRGTH